MPYLPADAPLTLQDLYGITRPPRAQARIDEWLPRSPLFLSTGRAAFLCALDSMGIGQGSEVLLPSYLCESVVSPVLALGAKPTFYEIDRSLRPDLVQLESSIGPATRAVVLIHYLGFPAPIQEARSICDRHAVPLVEDCAHALFSKADGRLLGAVGDAAFWSPWKSLPLPDGGLLAFNRATGRPVGVSIGPPSQFAVLRLAYRALGSAESAIGWSPRQALLRHNNLRRSLHDRTSGAAVSVRRGSKIARGLLAAASPERIVSSRRENYLCLLQAVRRSSWASPLFDDLPSGVCPLGLPIVTNERDRFRDALLSRGVNVRTYWEHLPVDVDTVRFPDAAWLRDHTLVLPVHQGLSSAHVRGLAQLLPTLRP